VLLAGTCCSEIGNVIGSLAEGFTNPKIISEMAFPDSCPGKNAHKTPLT